MKIWGTYESEAAKILRKKTPIMEKMDEEYTISYGALIHPDLEALARRDNFLSSNNDVNIIQMDSDGIVAEVSLNEENL